MPKNVLQKKHTVTKRNLLNDIRPHGMTLQELRFFVIYLSRINPMDESTRVVRFTIPDYQAIMGLSDKPNVDFLKKSIDGLLSKITGNRLPSGGFERFPCFKKGVVDQDEHGEWYAEINASDDALPLFFDLQREYFKYQLWNTLRLKSMNQLRMYEILKQYEKVGFRIITIDELKNLLGIDKKEYELYNNFKEKVLNVCKEALANYTDIYFTYEPYGKKGQGGKILELKFNIYKNKDFDDPLTLDKFIKTNVILSKKDDVIDEPETRYNERIELFSDALDYMFDIEQMKVIYHLMLEKVPDFFHDDLQCYRYLIRKLKDFQRLDKQNDGIKNKFAYFRKMIGSDD